MARDGGIPGLFVTPGVTRPIVLALTGSVVAASIAVAQPASLSGRVTDSSGAAMPGVTVTLVASPDQAPVVTVTDGAGAYSAEAIAAGVWTVRFELDGFEATTYAGVELRPGESRRLDCQLGVAPVTEDVTVYGRAPRDPPPPPQRPRAPDPEPLPDHDVASVCGPGLAPAVPAPLARIRAHRHDASRTLLMAGDEFVLDAGTNQGLYVGQNLVVRRTYRVDRAGGTNAAMLGEHTSGVIQVVMADPSAAFAVVVYACDEFVQGDYVEAFTPEPLRPPGPVGVPDYARAARVLFGDEGQMLGAPRRFMVIDRGRQDGIAPGQRMTLFRRSERDRRATVVIGEGLVVAAKDTSATIRIDVATDAIYFGDGAAPHRPDVRTPGAVTALRDDLPDPRRRR